MKFWQKVIVGFVLVFPLFVIFFLYIVPQNKVSISEKIVGLRERQVVKISKTFGNHYNRFNCSKAVLRKRTFPRMTNCEKYTTKLCQEGTFNLTALVSFPGSGNTWVRHLLEVGTGYFTGSIYFDDALYARGFLGESSDWSSGSTIATKVHVPYDKRFGFSKAVLIIRDPVRAAQAFINYMESGHVGWASPFIFSWKEWPSILLRHVQSWAALVKSWISQEDIPVLLIHYEVLKKYPLDEFRAILRFLGDSMEGPLHRKPTPWKTSTRVPYDTQIKIDEVIDEVNALLKLYGKQQLPLDNYIQYRNTFKSNQNIIK